MREIKFRAFIHGQMFYANAWNGESNSRTFLTIGDLFKFGESAEYMQFTGLLDKNGKEIFEGDVVAFASEDNVFIEIEYSNNQKGEPPKVMQSEVVFLNGIFCFDNQYGYEGREISFEQTEVIGNVYENPELA